MNIAEKFEKLGVDNAPGQEVHRKDEDLPTKGEPLPGAPVDFSHGDVDAHPPIPGALQTFVHGFYEGGKQAYTEYRGKGSIRKTLAEKLSALTGSSIDPEKEMILTPGTQGALFLAMGANIARGDKVAFVEPDYFANRKMVEFFEGEKLPVYMHWTKREHGSGLDLAELEKAFQDGA
ncbi:MAG: aminotransferase class I/II-fold pyridoxal phosphate-dependent enzyme, partial [Eubacteriales bacterium]|nr:aminotransferase class I/II-fold pyridoxal phosphate-dependent enzyme [Eubacteriales bacterium]